MDTDLEGKIDSIRLNFSDPWPKNRHESRRLTAPKYLAFYEKILKKSGEIIFKTDNKDLFDYSIESFKNSNFILKEINYDYPLTNNKDDVASEYEIKFRDLGQKINYLKVSKD